MSALGSGFFAGLGLATTTVLASQNRLDYSPLILMGISVVLFIIGGRKAETLREYPYD